MSLAYLVVGPSLLIFSHLLTPNLNFSGNIGGFFSVSLVFDSLQKWQVNADKFENEVFSNDTAHKWKQGKFKAKVTYNEDACT